MVGAAAMIGASLQAPLSGLALVLELTHSGFGLMVPMTAATAIATLVAFHVDGYSIYSARLPAYTADSAPAAPRTTERTIGLTRTDEGRRARKARIISAERTVVPQTRSDSMRTRSCYGVQRAGVSAG